MRASACRQNPSNLTVTTYLSDYNSANAAYYVQNDDGTEYLAMHMENQCSEDNNDMYGNDGNCNDWFIDPIPVVNADGSTSPGQTVARLNLINTSPSWNYTGRK